MYSTTISVKQYGLFFFTKLTVMNLELTLRSVTLVLLSLSHFEKPLRAQLQ